MAEALPSRPTPPGMAVPRPSKLELPALVVAFITVVMWFTNFPGDAVRDWIDVAQELSFFVAAAVAYPAIASLGERWLTLGWLVFAESLLLEICDEFTVEPQFGNETFTFTLGLAGLAAAGYGFWRASKRRSRELDEKARAQRGLEESLSTLKAVLEGSPDMISVRDLSGRYLMINQAAAKSAGPTPSCSRARPAR